MARPKESLDLQTILEAATEIADQHGFSEVTLANLAKKLLIRSPSLYNHFNGLPDLRKKLAVYGLNQLYSELETAGMGTTAEESPLALSKAYVGFARKHPGLYEATLQAVNRADKEIQREAEKIVELALEVLKGYDLGKDEALHAVRGLRSILHGFSSLEQKCGFNLNLDLDESLTFIINAFIEGIKKKN